MFKYLNPKRFYYAVGKKKFLEFILLAVFMLFFYGPLMYMCITAFGNVYEVPNIFPTEWGFKWWNFVFSQKSLVSSIVQSLTIAVITTVCSLVLCIPAAYSLARFRSKVSFEYVVVFRNERKPMVWPCILGISEYPSPSWSYAERWRF